MHGKWAHQRNYQANQAVVLCDGTNWFQAFGQSRKRRGFTVSVVLSNVTLARYVAVFFGQQPPNPATSDNAMYLINSVEGGRFFSYDDWGDAIQQEIHIFCNVALHINVSEIVDSTPECECYGN